MKIAVITDTHWGIRNDSVLFCNYFKRFLDDVFFPKIKEEGITQILHLGDLVDRRKYINFLISNRLRTDFIEPIRATGLHLHVTAGNHDAFYKDTLAVNSLKELLGYATDSVTVYEEPTEIAFDGLKIALLPWITRDNSEATLNLISTTQAQVAMGHLELKGFEMFRGTVAEHGLDPSLFDKFDVVASGHYHHKSTRDHIHYLGAPAEFTWSDFNDPRGFHIFDTKTREFEFIRNPYSMFKKFFYHDEGKELQQILNIENLTDYAGCIVKVIVSSKTNPYAFDLVINQLEEAGVADLQVVDDHLHIDQLDAEELISEAEDTFSIIRNFIADKQLGVERGALEKLFHNLYLEAQTT